MFKFWREGGTAHYQGSFSNTLDELLGQKIKNEVIKNVSEAWIKEHGVELLEKITPGEIEKAVRQAVAERIIK